MTDGPPSTQGREVGAEGLNAEDLGLISTRWLWRAHLYCRLLLATTNNESVVNTHIGKMLLQVW